MIQKIKYFIRRRKLLLISAIALLLLSYSYINQSQKEEALDRLLVQSLETFHYQPKRIDDELSEKIFDLYIKYLDYNKRFLTRADVKKLSSFRSTIDNDIAEGKFNFFNLSIKIIDTRIKEAEGYYQKILDQPFTFDNDEFIELDAEKLDFAKSKKELLERWRKSLKYQVLAKVVTAMESQEKAHAKNDTIELKSLAILEEEARKKLLKSHNDWFKRLGKLNRNDRLTTYFNVVTGIFDPHTQYYAPKDKENFDIDMSGKLEGIGAQLQQKDGFIKVTKIIAGSACWRQGELKAGDLILKVAQGEKEPVDITDMRLDDAVRLIRGKKGTEVRLTIKKPDGNEVVIPIIRDIVVLEATFAKSVIIDGKKRVGYIKLPSFYADFSNTATGRSCSKDVKKELQKLMAENVEGVILDLRNNGGGSLNDVVDMAGLFIPKGPMVQVKGREGKPYIMEDRNPEVLYTGPLIIMVNSNSASASEILAAAIQDYKRGVIVGTSSSTFGKGTVQRFYDLDNFLPEEYDGIKPLGQVKITTQKFYRINGGTTQLQGVVPDIVYPDVYYLLDRGEKEQDYPLGWDEIPAANYQTVNFNYNLDSLRAHSKRRIKNDSALLIIEEAALRLKMRQDSTYRSMSISKYQARKLRLADEAEMLEALGENVDSLTIIALKDDQQIIDSDTVKAAQADVWYKGMRKDIYLNETISIMEEINQ